MAKEVVNLDHNYSALNTKVDIVATGVTKVVEFHNSLLIKIDTKLEFDYKRFSKFEELVGSLKELISKLGSSSQSSISQESFSKMFLSLESSLKTDLAPLLKLVDLMPTNALPVHTWVQWGEKGVGSGVSKGVETGSSKDPSQRKVVGRVMST
ncbi:unnamed protein product [Lactuca saligna]|uniref:Uncharacterized protein n=1 Tax=Lactuca saligna TaxID=75948 RepID=A0AA35ZDX8_LACSI|nr:unnamed protein product [Lactuca saligna]